MRVVPIWGELALEPASRRRHLPATNRSRASPEHPVAAARLSELARVAPQPAAAGRRRRARRWRRSAWRLTRGLLPFRRQRPGVFVSCMLAPSESTPHRTPAAASGTCPRRGVGFSCPRRGSTTLRRLVSSFCYTREGLPSQVSLPPPPVRFTPVPPLRVSSLRPPSRMSLPALPVRVSLPALPVMMSLRSSRMADLTRSVLPHPAPRLDSPRG
jgi:hypothetical protein